jgi:hypothetical protein
VHQKIKFQVQSRVLCINNSSIAYIARSQDRERFERDYKYYFFFLLSTVEENTEQGQPAGQYWFADEQITNYISAEGFIAVGLHKNKIKSY